MARLGSLVATMAKIGLIGFGGGNALVPVIEREVSGEDGLITKEEFDKEVVVANITPGALPIEVASGAGRKIAGIPGMVLAAVSMGLPGSLLTLVLLALFANAAGTAVQQVRFASVGISMLIVVILLGYTTRSVSSKPPRSCERALSLALVIVVFALTCGNKVLKLVGISSISVISLSTLDVLGLVFFAIFFTGGTFLATTDARMRTGIAAFLSVLYLLCSNDISVFGAVPKIALQVLMVLLAASGLVLSIREEHGPSVPFPLRQMLGEAAVWVLFVAVATAPALVMCPEALLFASRAVLSVLMSFGGGDAYLVFGQGLFVDTGMIPSEQYFEQVVTISNAMPGSIICKVLTGVGYCLGAKYGTGVALSVALAGFGCGTGVSGLTFLVVYYIYERFEPLSIFRAIKRYIRPVIGGLLLTIAVTMFSLNVSVAQAYDMGVAVVVVLSAAMLALLYWLSNARKLPLVVLILIAIGGGLIVCNAIVALG